MTGRNVFDSIQEKLTADGIDLETLACGETAGDGRLKLVCLAGNLQQSVEELSETERDNVLMVRIDGDTSEKLDDWVETGAVKSRSEAAALFIREGLKVRGRELDELKDALHEVDEAKRKLHEKAREVLGDRPTSSEETKA